MTVKAAVLCRRLARTSPRYLLPCMLFPASQIVCVAGIATSTMLLHLEPATLFLTLILGVACIPLDSLLFTALGKAERADALREQARLLEAQIDTERMGARGLVSVGNEARDIRRKIAEQLHELDAQLSRGEVASSGQRVDEIIVLAGRKSLRVCDHVALDALISLKMREFKAKGVNMECSLKVPAELSISNSELCALVSNMLDLHEEVPHRDVGVELLLDFADDCLFRGFSCFDFSAREFPSALELPIASLGREDFVTLLDDGCHYVDGLHFRASQMLARFRFRS